MIGVAGEGEVVRVIPFKVNWDTTPSKLKMRN